MKIGNKNKKKGKKKKNFATDESEHQVYRTLVNSNATSCFLINIYEIIFCKLTCRSIAKYASKGEKLFCATLVQERTIFVVSILSSRRLPKENGHALIARLTGRKMR